MITWKEQTGFTEEGRLLVVPEITYRVFWEIPGVGYDPSFSEGGFRTEAEARKYAELSENSKN